MALLIDGHDITNLIAYGGFKWQRNDVDSPNTGRDMGATMHRGRVATKMRLDVTCRLLKGSELRYLLNLIYPEFVTVTYDDPQLGRRIATMYSNNVPATYQIKKPDGTIWWSGVTFPLIER